MWKTPRWDEIMLRLLDQPEIRVIHIVPHSGYREARKFAKFFPGRYYATIPGAAICGRGAEEIYLDVPLTLDMVVWLRDSLLCRRCPR